MKVTFTEKDFSALRNFQNKMNKVFGDTAYVGTDYSTILLHYSLILKNMIRPLNENKQYEFEVKFLSCKGCKRTNLFLCLSEETIYMCTDCINKVK